LAASDRVKEGEAMTEDPTREELGRRDMLLRTTAMPSRNALIRADLPPANL
jgi:hypothetical protein